jgi:hypothetical protein
MLNATRLVQAVSVSRHTFCKAYVWANPVVQCLPAADQRYRNDLIISLQCMRLSWTYFPTRSVSLVFRSPAHQRSTLSSRAMAPKRSTKKKADEDFIDEDGEEVEVEVRLK